MGVEVVSLGCRLNLSESESLRAMLTGEDNLVVINSCAVTAEAVRQTRQAIRRARRQHPDARLMVTGCAVEVERDGLAAMDIDGLIANATKLDPRAWNVPAAAAPMRSAAHTRAFVAVQNGCDHACSFCVIPQGRGPGRSLGLAQAVDAVRAEVDMGVGEVVLTGVDLTSWGHDLPNAPRLGDLVAAILRDVPGLMRLRLSSVDGVEMDPLLIELFATEPRVMPHLHLSLQHGADLILKRMKRRHLRHDALDLVGSHKARRAGLAIGADIIAGFPTETDAHHADNLSIIRELEIVHGHIFPYSPRAGTPAARMPQVAHDIIRTRAAQLRAAVADVRTRWLTSLIGTPLSVLAERGGTGHAENFATVRLPEGIAPGTRLTLTPTHLIEGLLA